jgi:hypothetical protein
MTRAKNNLSESQLKQALCAHFHISETQFDVFKQMLPTLQPWQVEFLNTLLEDRSKDKQDVALFRTMRAYDWNLGESSNSPQEPQAFKLPGGYIIAPGSPGRFAVVRIKDGVATTNLEFDSKDDAIAAAYALDRKDDPYRWRTISETCPASEFLFFACQDWAHSVELGKPVPVKTGYRGEEGYKVLGASWHPTHWCYQPEAPKPAFIEGDTVQPEPKALKNLSATTQSAEEPKTLQELVDQKFTAQMTVLSYILNRHAPATREEQPGIIAKELWNLDQHEKFGNVLYAFENMNEETQAEYRQKAEVLIGLTLDTAYRKATKEHEVRQLSD